MTPASLLKFLNAARNLAKQGFKQEDIIKFAKQEFGEVTDLVRLQINKIFKTKNQPLGKKDPVFDNTVEKFQLMIQALLSILKTHKKYMANQEKALRL